MLLFGLSHAFGDQETDGAYPPGNTIYANTGGFGIIDCNDGHGGDSDGDGICNSWEVSTPDPNDSNFVGLRVIFEDPTEPGVIYKYKLACNTSIQGDCPSPSQKDVYVELDWMKHHNPDQTAINDVVNAFKNAPTPINLHIQLGENPTNPTYSQTGNITQHFNKVRVSSVNGAPGTWVSYVKLKQTYFGTVPERQNTNSTSCPHNSTPTGISNSYSYNCLTAKRQVFHYGMFVNKIYSPPSNPESSSSGWAEIIGNDFFVSLGGFPNPRGTTDEQESSLMHEIGHNLGLWHGGMAPPTGIQEDDNCKPNYLSVMSYTYEYRNTTAICRPLDFSRAALNSLNELSLSDSAVGSYPYPSNNPPPPPGTQTGQPATCPTSGERPIWYSTPSAIKQGITGTTVNDWNQKTGSPYNQNLNKLSISGGCATTTNSTLSGYNDWANLYFAFQNSGNFNGGTVPTEPGTNGTNQTKLGIPIEIYEKIPMGNNTEGIMGFVADDEMAYPTNSTAGTTGMDTTHPTGSTGTTGATIPDFSTSITMLVLVASFSFIIINKRYG